ncbi:NAD-P-binding protein [Peniophora sp. CONT]|nr:NAD-P-binding protein [Peniophora sp. CONT]
MSTSLLANRIVVITGSSRGIGRGCAVECAKHGAKGVVLHYFGDSATQAEVDELATELSTNYGTKVVTVPGDIGLHETSLKIVGEAIQAFGRIDVLVSNAGICPFSDFLEMDIEVWHRTRNVNLDGAFYITQAVARQMKEQVPQGGSIIGISSISALVGGGQQVHYTPTKAGILSLMQSTAVALGQYGIRANAVLPGTILTDINKEDLSDVEKRTGMEKRTCLGRLGQPDDIAGPVVFLASDMAKYVTGASLLVDGGLFVNLQ